MHSCMHCGKVLQTATALRNHIYIHTGEKPWQCDKCPAVFRLYSTLYDHRRVSHVVGGKFKCPQCPCRFQAQLGLKRHVGIYHPKMNLEAMSVSKKLGAKGKAVQQIAMGRVTTTVLSSDGTRTYPCNYCGKVFYKSQYLRNHLPVHTGERRSVCHLCGVGFKSSSNLLAHKKVSHVEGGKHKCERCTCVFASLLGLVRHRRLLHGIGKASMMSHKVKKAKLIKAPMHFLAAFSSDGFEDEEDMEVEEEEEDEEEQEEQETVTEDNFECEECGKVLASAAGLRNHLMIHSGEKPWICNICGLSFRLNSTLYGHKKSSHVPNGPFKCDICPCSFAAQFGLRRHKICFHDAAESTVEPIVTVKSSKCQYCKKVFKSMNILQQHIQLVHRSEDMERPVKCPKCDCAYTTARSLRKHTKTAHVPGGKKCPKCPCAFSTSQARKAHHTKMHVKPNLTSLKIQRTPVVASNGEKKTEISNASKLDASNPLPCDRCNKLFYSETSLKGHLRYCSQQNIQCDLCDESFSIHSNMIRHKRSCHVSNGPYKCNQCTHCYATTRGISRHMAHAHGVYSRERNRTSHGSVFSPKKVLPALQMKPTLAIHRIIQNSKMRDIRKRKPYQRVPETLRKHKCLLCGNAFSSNGNYKKHMQTSHVPGGKYPCSKCSCVFNTYNALNSHVGNRHSSRKSLNENLQLSTKMISQKRPASASPHKPSIPTLSKIKFNFFRPSASLPVPSPSPPVSPPHSAIIKRKPSELLKRMALIVGGNDTRESSPEPPTPPRIASPKVEMKVLPVPFTTPSGIPKCDVCGKIYSNMATLRNHLTVHTGEKPFPCDLCGQRFRQKGDVVSHKKTNHSDGKYKCGLCPCRFISTQGYKRHMVQIHENAKSQAQVQQQKVVQPVVKPSKGQPLASIMKPEKKESVEYGKLGKVTLAFSSENSKVNSSKDGRKFSCELCDASFNHIQNLLRHRKSSHVPWGEYKCSLCSCSFVSPTSLRTHQAIFHHSDKKGGKHAGLPGKPKRERAAVPSSTQSSADEGEAQEDPQDIRAPKIIKNQRGKKTFLCQMCGASFNSYGNSTKHITNSHVDNGSYPCKKCPCIFVSFKGLTRHESIYHTGGNKGAKRQIFTHVKRELKLEVEESEGAAGSQHEMKNRYEDDSSDLEEEHSPEIFENNFEDEEECLLIRGNEINSNEVDPLDTSSSQDEDSQSDDRVLSPKIEGTSLAQQDEEDADPFMEPDLLDLQARIPSITVTKVADTNSKPEKILPRPHGTVFGDVGVLQKERINRFAIYAKKDQHVCDICNMKFSQLGSLKGHMRIHTGDKPYQCRYCGICFRLNGTLATHVKKCHHEANPYQCEYCSCQFVTSGVLTQHIFKYHPEKAESLDEA
ncbi:unnamed protein product [Allacma fusca]|uniref:C2H2-type domain-containing protein n=1 Tax=Allacma fusca TaxID=39272 RepID=A0A8J2NU77_9HEXA|nr:unnamed protein product [Allacma fusca]